MVLVIPEPKPLQNCWKKTQHLQKLISVVIFIMLKIGNDIGNTGIEAITKALEKNKTLTSIDLSSNFYYVEE
jgi:hypothetical protein